jgi:hypothetical protein
LSTLTKGSTVFADRAAITALAIVLALLCSYVSTGLQVVRLTPGYVATTQCETHRQTVEGIYDRSATGITGYRILAPLLIDAVHRGLELPLPKALTYTLFGLRAAVFVLWFWSFRRLGLSAVETVAGVFYVFYATAATFYNEDLNHYEPLNLAFLLLFFILLTYQRDGWLLPVVVLGSLAKETAAILPVLYLAWRAEVDWTDPRGSWRRNATALRYAAAMMVTSVAIYVALRWYLDPAGMLREIRGYGYGPRVITASLTRLSTPVQWFITFNVFLVLPFLSWKTKPARLRQALVWFCPAYILAHFLVSYMDETRVFLFLLVVLLPMSFDTLRHRFDNGRRAAMADA